jgi:hypothetical protein
MALTLEKEQRLTSVGLVGLFNDHRQLWKEMAQQAHDYVKQYVDRASATVRIDDVVGVLVPALRVTDILTAKLAEKKLTQKYWADWFGDYVLEKVWNEIQGGGDDD